MEAVQDSVIVPAVEVVEEKPRADGRPGLRINAKNSAYHLKLRHSFQVNERCRLEIGYDHAIGAGVSRPWGALRFQLDPEDKNEGYMCIDNDHITVHKHLKLKMHKLSVGVDAHVGVTTKGHPHVSLSLDNVPLMLAAAATLLYLKKPIHISKKETGGLSFELPLGGAGSSYHLQERAEVDCTLRREGRAVTVNINQFNGVVRLRQDVKED